MKRSLGPRTLAYPTPCFVVGSYDPEGRANAMVAAWAGICCSQPPCIAVSLRKATYTHGNLMARRAFTVSIPSEDHVAQADYLGIASGRTIDKFAHAGLTPARSLVVDAPYVEEFPLVLECRVAHVFELGLHTQFVGEILDVKADPEVLGSDGMPEIEKVRPFLFAPGEQQYYAVGHLLAKAFTAGKGIKKG